MAKYEVIAICPVHPKSLVFVSVDAPTESEAIKNAVEKVALCEVKPNHTFRVEAEHIIGWQPTTPIPHPGREPAYVPPAPPEKIYYVEPSEIETKLMKREWWK